MKIVIAAVLIFGLMLFRSVAADTLSLDQCIDVALKNNLSVKTAQNTYSVSRARVLNAWGNFLPGVSIGAGRSYRWSGYGGTDPFTGRNLGPAGTTFYNGSLSIGQAYQGLGLSTYADLKSRQSNSRSAYFALSDSRSALVLLVKENYYSALKAKMLLDVSRDAVKRGEERLRVAQSRFDLGSASMSDVLKAKVQFGNDKLDVIRNSNAYESALTNLAFIMGIDVNREFDIAEESNQGMVSLNFDADLNEALAGNPGYRQAHFDYSAARSDVLSNLGRLLPTLSISVSHSTSVPQFANLTDFKSIDAGYSFNVSMNFNIFNNFFDYASIKSARATAATLRENLRNAGNAVALAVKQAYLDLQQSEEALKVSDESVAAAQEDVNLAREKYNLGAATILEVLDAEVSLKQAQTNRVQAVFDYNLAISGLERAMGR